MRFALIDNSTLTGVQRLLGDIPVVNTISTDMDMVCLETLVQAILFYDEVVVLDDYKAEHRAQRHATFPFLRFMTLPEATNKSILAQAKAETDNIVPRVEGGEFTDKEFSEFFDLLRMNILFTWDMSSSAFFLTQKMLAVGGGVDLEKYSRLADAIHFELKDKKATAGPKLEQKRIVLVASDGRPIDPKGTSQSDEKGLSRQAEAFFASLNWLAFRTIYFSLAATALQADLLLHPIRHAFHITWLRKLKSQDPSWYLPIIEAMSKRAGSALSDIVSTTQPAVMASEIPLFSAWLVRQTGDPRKIIEAALLLKDDKRMKIARAAFIELDQLAEQEPEEYGRRANAVIANLDRALNAIKTDFNVATSQGSATGFIIKTVLNIGSTLIGWDIPAIPADLMKWRKLETFSEKLRGRYVAPLYRSVVGDLASVARLGELNDQLRSRVAYSEGADAYLAKKEPFEFFNVESFWKRPM